MLSKRKSIVETHPHLVAEWHPSKNGSLVPSNFTAGSEVKIWWICEQGLDHEWKANLNSRARGNGCPICSNRKIVSSNCLATTHPELAKQWHPSKNGALTPLEIGAGSNKKVWWKCENGLDHEWSVSTNSRTFFLSGCPFCSGKKVSKTNCLSTTHPHLAKEWHPRLNENLSPDDVTAGSTKKVWWKCDKSSDHEWLATVNARSSGHGCGVCHGKIITNSNCLATTNPEKARWWHPTNNKELSPFMIANNSTKKVWWKCDKGLDHEWETTPNNFSGCPACSGRMISESNRLSAVSPEYAAQFHPTKNGNLKPNQVYAGGQKLWWWKCEKGEDHEWRASLDNRLRQKQGCPYCAGQKLSLTNTLMAISPEYSAQWHPTKNGDLKPNQVYAGGQKLWWWKCDKGEDHEWQASLDNRLRQKQGCPFCSLTPQSKQELTITFELKTLFPGIDPKGFKTSVGGKLRAIDIFIPVLNLCIEFDGSYWHKGKSELDKIKSELLLNDGFQLIRVREEPLKKINDTDVVSRKPYNGKQVTNDILSMILIMYKLDEELVNRIKHYQLVRELKNEKGLNRYIANILKEKSDRSTKSRTKSQNL